MGGIIVAMPRPDDTKKICDILRNHGYSMLEICTTGAGILSKAHQLDSGIVICTKSFKDMYCNEIVENLPDYFDMLLITSKEGIERCPQNIVTITMPFRAADLISSIDMLFMQQERKIRRNRKRPIKRSDEEQKSIEQAKHLLMERNSMTEPEAFRYIQKCSMDTGTNMAETAQMILLLQMDI